MNTMLRRRCAFGTFAKCSASATITDRPDALSSAAVEAAVHVRHDDDALVGRAGQRAVDALRLEAGPLFGLEPHLQRGRPGRDHLAQLLPVLEAHEEAGNGHRMHAAAEALPDGVVVVVAPDDDDRRRACSCARAIAPSKAADWPIYPGASIVWITTALPRTSRPAKSAAVPMPTQIASSSSPPGDRLRTARRQQRRKRHASCRRLSTLTLQSSGNHCGGRSNSLRWMSGQPERLELASTQSPVIASSFVPAIRPQYLLAIVSAST